MRERWFQALVFATVGAAAAATADGVAADRGVADGGAGNGGVADGGTAARTDQDFALIERGRYLTVVADCGACHTDPAGGRPFAGGRAIGTPFGNVLAPNITPDRDTGIGAWSAAQFDAALRQGIMPDGKQLYPAMPYVYYSRMSRDDVLAIRAYLGTVEPVHHEVV